MTGRSADVPHWLKYVRWDVISRWRTRAKAAEGSLRYPYAFASRETRFPAINGGVLWLMSSPRYGTYRQPPSIIARLEINDVVAANDPKAEHVDPAVRRFAGWIAIADEPPDAYLPLNNASQILETLRFRSKVSRLPELPAGTARPYGNIPQHFRMHRELTPATVHRLESFAGAVRSGRRVFVSYRWDDFTGDPWVGELATALGDTVSCWLDNRNMPQAEDKHYDEGLLEDILNDAIRQSLWLVALMRPGYVTNRGPGQPDFVRHEWTTAGGDDRMNRVAVVFGELPAAHDWIDPDRDTVITVQPGASASMVARQVRALLPPVHDLAGEDGQVDPRPQ